MPPASGEVPKTNFTKKHFKLLLRYCKTIKKDPRYSYNKFHRNFSHYHRRRTTIDLINKAYNYQVITGPEIYANTGIEVEFYKKLDDPLDYLKKCENDGETTLAFALHGDWSFIRFKNGASIVEHVESILPYSYSTQNLFIENLSINKKGKLPMDPYPHGWYDEHWEIFNLLRKPKETKMNDVAKKTGLSWIKTTKYFKEVLEQCKVFSGFFPLGRKGYSLQLVTFKTDYEIGILEALRKLNRTTFIYKVNGILILCLHLIPRPMDFNISTKKFYDLQEKGYIRDLHVCTPIDWNKDLQPGAGVGGNPPSPVVPTSPSNGSNGNPFI